MSFLLSALSAFLLGMSKSGLKGMGVVIVTLMALVHGAKASTGILLPLLVFADVLAVSFYSRYVKRKYLFRLLPWMALGVVIATVVGKDLSEELFKKGMAIIILLSVVIMVLWEKYEQKRIPEQLWFAGFMGLAAGFTTMIGNLAGAFANIFFLAMRLPKNEFIGTAAWLFFIINLFKLPFHIFSWGTINADSLQTDLYLIPAVILGFVVGLQVVKLFKDQQYRIFILVVTAIGAISLLVK